MDAVPVPVQILCRQCSAPLPVEQGSQYVKCEFCGATNVVEKGRTVFHYAVKVTVRRDAAEKALRRWMAGNDTIKGLDKKAQIKETRFEYFPMWLVTIIQNERETMYLEPAAAISVSELKRIRIPAGDLEPFQDAYAENAITATVPYDAMFGWLKDEHHIEQGKIKGVSLVHLPIYFLKYTYEGEDYTVVVDGASGEVFANIYPSKWEVPYVALGSIAFAAYFCAAFIPLTGFLVNDAAGLGLATLIYAAVVIVITIPFFIAAMVISAKV